MSSPLRVGFLGAGLNATYHSKSIRRARLDFPVVRAGVFDPDVDRSRAFAAASGHEVLDSPAAVIDSCDAVYVCTWTSEHLPLVAQAVAAGRAVFCEKPLGTDLAQARAITDLLETSGVVHQVGLVLRHSPAYLVARELVTDERAGRPMSVAFRDDQFIPVQGHYASTWRGDRRRAGAGTLLEHSIHDVDMLHFLVGSIERVSAHQSNFHGLDGIEDVVSASMAFALDGPPVGTLTSVWHDNLARPSLRRVEIFCERRHVVIEGDWFGPVTWSDADGRGGVLEGGNLVDRAIPLGHDNPDAAFLRAVHRSEPAHPSARHALAAHEVVDAVYRSAREHGSARSVGVAALQLREVPVEAIRPLRRDVLRRGMEDRSVAFDGDDEPTTLHLALVDDDGEILATSTWLDRPCAARPGERSRQLRGMATHRALQGSGAGSRLLAEGLRRAAADGVRVVWANARDTALDFYARHGFVVDGEGFVESVTRLPHHVVVHDLAD